MSSCNHPQIDAFWLYVLWERNPNFLRRSTTTSTNKILQCHKIENSSILSACHSVRHFRQGPGLTVIHFVFQNPESVRPHSICDATEFSRRIFRLNTSRAGRANSEHHIGISVSESSERASIVQTVDIKTTSEDSRA